MIIDEKFYDRNAVNVAGDLLGHFLVRKIDGEELVGKIIETEAYMGKEDKASHSYNGKKTERTRVLYKRGGIAYIYTIYGIHQCLNVVVNKEEKPQAVFIRAIEPIHGEKRMWKYRNIKKSNNINLSNGPAKLCQALNIDENLNEVDVCIEGDLYIKKGEKPSNIETSKRINIDYAEEDKHKPWRFLIPNNPYISK